MDTFRDSPSSNVFSSKWTQYPTRGSSQTSFFFTWVAVDRGLYQGKKIKAVILTSADNCSVYVCQVKEFLTTL